MAVPNVQTTRLAASIALRDRLLVAVTAAAAPTAAAVVAGQGFSGLIVTDRRGGRCVRTLKLAYGSGLVVGKDTEACLNYRATVAQPMFLPDILGGAAPSLASCMRDQLIDGADFALTPTGLIKDVDTLNAAVAEANAVNRADIVLAVPIPADILRKMDYANLSMGLSRSNHPVALIIIGQFDPYQNRDVAVRVRALLIENAHVFLHRTDFAAFESLARGALAGPSDTPLRSATPSSAADRRRRGRTRQTAPRSCCFPISTASGTSPCSSPGSATLGLRSAI